MLAAVENVARRAEAKPNVGGLVCVRFRFRTQQGARKVGSSDTTVRINRSDWGFGCGRAEALTRERRPWLVKKRVVRRSVAPRQRSVKG